MYLATMLIGIIAFGHWFEFSSVEVVIHSMFAISGFFVGKM